MAQTSWERTDQVYQHIGHHTSSDWLLQPRGTRLQKLIKAVDEAVDKMTPDFEQFVLPRIVKVFPDGSMAEQA